MSRTAWLLLGAGALLACAETPARPSIVLVTLDTLRADHVGAYGGPEQLTPHLDALAGKGLLHEAAFTSMPTTGPAHASLFTGLAPHEHGVRRNGDPLPTELEATELASRLRLDGFATAAFVTSQILAPAATRFRGFEIYDAPSDLLRSGAEAVRQALYWLSVEERRPVFLWVHLYDPHAPYGGTEYDPRGGAPDLASHGFVKRERFADPGARKRMAERYARGVRNADQALGELVRGVRRALGDPLIAVVSDHGEALDEHLDTRGYAYDHGEFLDGEQIQIALVLAGPGVSPGRSPGVASIRDLYTTLLAAAGIEDSQAAARDRRDLRRPVEGARLARVERRGFPASEARALGPTLAQRVRAHAVAVSDGQRTLVLAEDGSLSTRPQPEAPELVAAARDVLRAVREAESTHAPVRLEPSLREALESLGYVRE